MDLQRVDKQIVLNCFINIDINAYIDSSRITVTLPSTQSESCSFSSGIQLCVLIDSLVSKNGYEICGYVYDFDYQADQTVVDLKCDHADCIHLKNAKISTIIMESQQLINYESAASVRLSRGGNQDCFSYDEGCANFIDVDTIVFQTPLTGYCDTDLNRITAATLTQARVYITYKNQQMDAFETCTTGLYRKNAYWEEDTMQQIMVNCTGLSNIFNNLTKIPTTATLWFYVELNDVQKVFSIRTNWFIWRAEQKYLKSTTTLQQDGAYFMQKQVDPVELSKPITINSITYIDINSYLQLNKAAKTMVRFQVFSNSLDMAQKIRVSLIYTFDKDMFQFNNSDFQITCYGVEDQNCSEQIMAAKKFIVDDIWCQFDFYIYDKDEKLLLSYSAETDAVTDSCYLDGNIKMDSKNNDNIEIQLFINQNTNYCDLKKYDDIDLEITNLKTDEVFEMNVIFYPNENLTIKLPKDAIIHNDSVLQLKFYVNGMLKDVVVVQTFIQNLVNENYKMQVIIVIITICALFSVLILIDSFVEGVIIEKCKQASKVKRNYKQKLSKNISMQEEYDL